MNFHTTYTPDGQYCMEAWLGDKKLTVYATKEGKTECLMVEGDGKIGETDSLFAGMEWLCGAPEQGGDA